MLVGFLLYFNYIHGRERLLAQTSRFEDSQRSECQLVPSASTRGISFKAVHFCYVRTFLDLELFYIASPATRVAPLFLYGLIIFAYGTKELQHHIQRAAVAREPQVADAGNRPIRVTHNKLCHYIH